jgi:hypothetical protein
MGTAKTGRRRRGNGGKVLLWPAQRRCVHDEEGSEEGRSDLNNLRSMRGWQWTRCQHLRGRRSRRREHDGQKTQNTKAPQDQPT